MVPCSTQWIDTRNNSFSFSYLVYEQCNIYIVDIKGTLKRKGFWTILFAAKQISFIALHRCTFSKKNWNASKSKKVILRIKWVKCVLRTLFKIFFSDKIRSLTSSLERQHSQTLCDQFVSPLFSFLSTTTFLSLQLFSPFQHIFTNNLRNN